MFADIALRGEVQVQGPSAPFAGVARHRVPRYRVVVFTTNGATRLAHVIHAPRRRCDLVDHSPETISQNSRSRSSGLPTSHSQIVMTRQPASASRSSFEASRVTFDANLAAQNSGRVAGVVAILQPGCRCQKQPWMKTAARYLGSTMSGRPGRLRTCTLNRSPVAWRYRRTSISG